MDQSHHSKEEHIRLMVKGHLGQHAVVSKLVRPGETFTFAHLYGLTKLDLEEYFEKNGYPAFTDTKPSGPNAIGDFETVWTLDNGEYIALWLEKGTQSNLYSTQIKEDFQLWWNKHLLEEYEFQLTYPRRA